jgi:hypothetical protein
MAKKYSSVPFQDHVAIRSSEAEIQYSLESAYLPGIVLTVSVASIFWAISQNRWSGCHGWRLTVGS